MPEDRPYHKPEKKEKPKIRKVVGNVHPLKGPEKGQPSEPAFEHG